MSAPRLILLPLLLAIAGCGPLDPYKREGAWRPAGVNDANLTAMVVEPAELQRGVAAEGALGETAAAAVERLFTDRVRALPTTITTQGMGGAAAGGGAQ
jgi:hypothetical protein